MDHEIYRVTAFKHLAPYTLEVEFDDHTKQVINFEPVLGGALFGPLRDLALFNQVQICPECHTLVWPNNADFDPADLHDWPEVAEDFATQTQRWNNSTAKSDNSSP